MRVLLGKLLLVNFFRLVTWASRQLKILWIALMHFTSSLVRFAVETFGDQCSF